MAPSDPSSSGRWFFNTTTRIWSRSSALGRRPDWVSASPRRSCDTGRLRRRGDRVLSAEADQHDEKEAERQHEGEDERAAFEHAI